jgi:hypothetical protein
MEKYIIDERTGLKYELVEKEGITETLKAKIRCFGSNG